MARLRHIARLMVPGWLFVESGQKIVEAFALMTDVYRQKLRSGLEARFPSRAGESAAALIGKYRLIPRGRDETLAHYAARLKAWRFPRGHRVRGSAFSLLTQVYHYWGGVVCWTHDRNQNKRALDVDENTSYAYDAAWDWDGGAAAQWGRQWLVIDLSGVAIAQDYFVDGGTIGIGGTTPGDWVAMRRLVDAEDPHRWMAAGTQPEWCIVSLDGSAPTPDSTWAYWGVESGSVVTPARSGDFRYVALRKDLKEYPGEADRAAAAFWMPYGYSLPELSEWSALFVTTATAAGVTTITEQSTGSQPHHVYTTSPPTGLTLIAVRAKRSVGTRNLQLSLTGGTSPLIKCDLGTGDVVAESGGGVGFCNGVADASGYYTFAFGFSAASYTYLTLSLLDATYTTPYAGDGTSAIDVVSDLFENLVAGDADSFPATITLLDGSSYAGDPTQFRATITLPDDGDTPI